MLYFIQHTTTTAVLSFLPHLQLGFIQVVSCNYVGHQQYDVNGLTYTPLGTTNYYLKLFPMG